MGARRTCAGQNSSRFLSPLLQEPLELHRRANNRYAICSDCHVDGLKRQLHYKFCPATEVHSLRVADVQRQVPLHGRERVVASVESRARNATYGDENLGANCRSSGEHSAIFCSLHCPERTTNVKIVGLSAPIRVGDENNRTREERPVSFRFNICADQHCLCGVWSCYFWGNLVVVLHN